MDQENGGMTMDGNKAKLYEILGNKEWSSVEKVQAIHELGYRLDPFPNGKSKPELIERIEALEAERDKTRNLLRRDHEWYVKEAVITENGTVEEAMEWHHRRKPTCSVCAFLAETSTVKP